MIGLGGKTVALALCSGFLFGPAYAMELNGAWASEADVCDKIFEKKGSQLSFRQNSDTFGSGFIIDGNHIRGQTATCSIKSRKEIGAEIHLVAACSMEVMFSDVQLSVRIDNTNTVTRFFPGLPDISIKYFRCSI